eukprot:TRINITY_DN8044_c2_g1_i1.p1 TRINITY_DN8044_c2_g1~~TRINITY_DN8044_c2_g1_i1.p1  ORF type:complete len:481 (+),score=32.44 TRINITY_DN8044_c2_g1_i1:390-1832(+)
MFNQLLVFASIAATSPSNPTSQTPDLFDVSNINGRFQPHVDPGYSNTTGGVVSYKTQPSYTACRTAATKGGCYSYTWFGQDAVNSSYAGLCWGVNSRFYDWFPSNSKGAVSGRIWYGCRSSEDCALNGQCVSGSCQCNKGWTGVACTQLNEGVTKYNSGYQHKTNNLNSSSWGGPFLYDSKKGIYHMWVSEMLNNCGLDTWAQNSRVIHSTSSDPLGPYEPQDVIFTDFSHEPDVKQLPNGSLVMYLTQRVPNKWPVCECSNGSTPKDGSCDLYPAHPDNDPTVMSISQGFNGPWSPPVVVMSNTDSDTNLTPWFGEDGLSMVGLWRTFFHPNGTRGYSRIHWVTATDYRKPESYKYDTYLWDDLFGLGGPTEDPFLYKDVEGNFHAIFHNMYGCYPCGGHAFSPDNGVTWVYTGGDAYSDTLHFEAPQGNGDPVADRIARRERPHLVFDNERNPMYLSTGVVPGWNHDYSFTSVVPIMA